MRFVSMMLSFVGALICIHTKNNSRGQILTWLLIATGHQEQAKTCPGFSSRQHLLCLCRDRGLLPYIPTALVWTPKYNQRDPAWRCAILLMLLWTLLQTLWCWWYNWTLMRSNCKTDLFCRSLSDAAQFEQWIVGIAFVICIVERALDNQLGTQQPAD